MARFGIEIPEIQLTGELHQQQGVVDKSKATMIDAVGDAAVKGVTLYQQQGLANDLKAIDQEFEQAQVGPSQEDAANPAVAGFEAELKRLNAARSKISETQYEARKNAALKARINQTPGLADALNRTAAQFDKLNEYSLVNQAIAAQKTAQSQYDDLVKFGVDKLGLPPTWTNDPKMVQYAQIRAGQHAEAAANRDIMTSLDLITKQEGANKALEDRMRLVSGRAVQGQLSGQFLDMYTKGYGVTLGAGDESIQVNAMDAAAVAKLSTEQRFALQKQLESDFLNEQGILFNQINTGEIDGEMLKPHMDHLATMYNTMIAFANPEGDAKFVTNENTVLSRDNLGVQREVTALDLQYKATDITYNLEQLDRTRALEIQQKELDLVNSLVVAGATGEMMKNPAVLRWKVLNSLGLVDTQSADVQTFIDKLAEGGIDNEREAALQFGDFSKWQEHMSTKTGIYRRMRVDLATPASASVVAEDVANTIAQVEKAVKDPLRPMSMDEVGDIMNIFASGNYGKLVEQYSEQFGDVGVRMEQVIAPVIARDFVVKATNLYAGEGINNVPLLSVVDGKFAIGNRPVSGALVKSDAPEARIVKGLNNAAQAIANTQNIPLELANKKVMSMIPMDRMINLFERNLRGQSVGSEFPEAAPELEGQLKSAIDNLYGEGAYRKHEVDSLLSQGYTEYGPTPAGNGTIFIGRGGDKVVIGD